MLSTFERKERYVNDTIHYDSDLEQHWWRKIDFPTLVGQAGIVLNPDKFQFAERSVDFAGFRVSDSTMTPSHVELKVCSYVNPQSLAHGVLLFAKSLAQSQSTLV